METTGVVGAAVTARGLGVRGPRGPVFENVDLEMPAGGFLVVHGPGGSGRTSLLLALSGRLRLTAGAARVGEHLLPGQERRVRRLVAVARAEPATGLEGRLRVRELMAERRWIGRGVTAEAIEAACAVTGIDPPADALVEELDPATATLLAVALTVAERPAAVVVDDIERGCTAPQREQVWQALDRVRARGITVLAAATDLPVRPADLVPVGLPSLSGDRLPEPEEDEEEIAR
ncbi:ATP-binding cassette domain-containing protein [Amycolatopsis cynarae]|uniref:ATP-binding cassette domain-containing protein n=1 Tax=Amycolatopsis cynarae TaxID=2995223 RepID=A0ABY7B9W0_9PSEU|nr:ATP-binding cassette domain-containing protein [Amycolatopsis sp. HUAS 11-8]WAL68448.1 ATP-binding cassette domain-containing protein [Amycolatopsis sp. HUAS 11-8]